MELSARVLRFLEQPNHAVIAVVRPDGFPMPVVTWYGWEGGRILVNMDAKRARLEWMRSNPRVGVSIFDAGAARHVSLVGTVVEMHDDVGLVDMDRLTVRYTGRRFWDRDARRVSAWIEPTGWHVWDESGQLSTTEG